MTYNPNSFDQSRTDETSPTEKSAWAKAKDKIDKGIEWAKEHPGKAAVSLGAAATAATLGIGLIFANNGDHAPIVPDPDPSASADSTPSPSPSISEVTIPSISPSPSESPSPSPTETATVPERPPAFDVNKGITVEQYTTPDAVVEALLQAETDWINAGATPENRAFAFTADGGGAEAFATKLADQNKIEFTNALLPAGWEDNESLRTIVQNSYDANVATLTFYFYTGAVSSADREPYHRGVVLAGNGNIVSNQPNESTLEIAFDRRQTDNSDSNTVGERLKYDNPTGLIDTGVHRSTTTWEKQGTKWVLTNNVVQS